MGLGNGHICGPTGPFLRSLLKPLCYPNLSAFIGDDGQPPLDLVSTDGYFSGKVYRALFEFENSIASGNT